MRKKHPYLLFELLIAFSLAILCIVPLVRTPVDVFQSTCKSLEKMELQRVAELSFAAIKEKLYRQEIPWETFLASRESAELKRLEPIELNLEGSFKKKFERGYLIWKGKQEFGPQNEEYVIAHVKILFRPLANRKSKEEIAFKQDYFLTKQPKEKPESPPPTKQ